MDFLIENWAQIAALVTMGLALLGGIAELTPWAWDNKALKVVREIWAKIPVFETNPNAMGRKP